MQAAYEVLTFSAEDAPSTQGFNFVLDERLNDIRKAFGIIYHEGGTFCDQVFKEFETDLQFTINCYSSYRDLKQNAQRDIIRIWSQAIRRIALFVEERVGSIADRHDRWLQDYLKPVIDAAKTQNPPRWFERISSGWC